jgi:hypothetical protein
MSTEQVKDAKEALLEAAQAKAEARELVRSLRAVGVLRSDSELGGEEPKSTEGENKA